MEDLRHITAVILAGGLGRRLRAVVADQPKVLAEVGGHPFLTYLLDQLSTAGFREVLLCTGYLGDQIHAYFGSQYQGLHLRYAREVYPLGTGGALAQAARFVHSETVLVMNGDSYCDTDLPASWCWHQAQQAQATLVLCEMADVKRYGRVNWSEARRILEFQEKSATGGPGWINTGLYWVKRALLETLPRRTPLSLEYDVLPAWIGRGLYAYPVRGRFIDIGTPESLAEAQHFFSPEPSPPPGTACAMAL